MIDGDGTILMKKSCGGHRSDISGGIAGIPGSFGFAVADGVDSISGQRYSPGVSAPQGEALKKVVVIIIIIILKGSFTIFFIFGQDSYFG